MKLNISFSSFKKNHNRFMNFFGLHPPTHKGSNPEKRDEAHGPTLDSRTTPYVFD